METQVPFPKLAASLKEQGVKLVGATFAKDPTATWANIPLAARAEFLRHAGITASPDALSVRVAKTPGKGKRGLESLVVIFDDASPSESDEALEFALVSEPESAPGHASAPEGVQGLAHEHAPETPSPVAETPAPEPAGPEDAHLFATPADEEPATPVTARTDTPAAPTTHARPAAAPPTEPTEPAAIAPAHADAATPDAPAPEAKGKGLRSLLNRFAAKKEEAATPPTWTGPVTEIPEPTTANLTVVDTYPVQEPYAYIRILYDSDAHEHRYEVVEPALSERERNILDFIENTIVDVIEVGLSAMSREQAAEMLRKHCDEVIYDYSIVLNALSREKLLYYILRDFLGSGKLDPMMRDEFIEDISCDGPGVSIFLYHRKYESIKSSTVFVDDKELDSFVIQMAQRSGKHVSIADPLLDATLPDGSRLNATLSDEVTSGGSTFTIRKFRDDPFTLPDLVKFGTMNEDLMAYWWLAVQNGASAIYAGGTASGKTTSLNAILLFIPPQMKIVSIEDTREINIPHENWIAGVTRSGFGPRDNNGRQAGEIDMFTLLKAALRQRPEYILVGEVRGQEATALFQAMATGHTAYGTMHADSTEAVIHRLESDPISIPRSLLEALDIVSIQIQTRIGDRRVRRTKELVEIVGLDPHTREILTNEVFTWSPVRDEYEFSGVSYVLERIQIERNMNESDMREEFTRRKRIIRWMVKNNIRALADVGRIIATYYRDPAQVMALVDADTESDNAAEANASRALAITDGTSQGDAPRTPMALQLTDDDAMAVVPFPGEEEAGLEEQHGPQ